MKTNLTMKVKGIEFYEYTKIKKKCEFKKIHVENEVGVENKVKFGNLKIFF